MYIKTFDKISKKDTDIAGGKGASLGEMTQAGISVPPGFVVLADAFEKFLVASDIIVEIDAQMDKVNPKDINSVEGASVKIRKLILDSEMPLEIAEEIKKQFKKLNAQLVAVRSSATAEDSAVASWAGELETYLNVTKENLLESVKKCWSSLFTPRAIFYRHEKKLHQQKVSVAVVVQKMIQSEISGICFTVHPVTKDRNQLVIEAGYGLGEAIVGGMITPDTYIIDKSNWQILDANISQQEMMIVRDGKSGVIEKKIPRQAQDRQKLPGEQIIKLAKLCAKIESHYQFPQDIEWAIESDKIYITQSRPITTLGDFILKQSKENKSKKIIFEKTITRDWPLVIAEMLLNGFTEEFKKQFSFGYSDVIFVFYSDHLDLYRAPEEHIGNMRGFILKELKKDPKFLHKCSKSLLKYYNNFTKIIKEINKTDIKKLSNKEFSKLFSEFMKVHQELEPTFVINFWFPIQMEKHPAKDRYAAAIEIASKTRADTEKVGPEGDRIARVLAEEASKRMFCSKKYYKFLLSKEINDFLLKGKLPNKEEIKNREEGFIFGSKGIKFTTIEKYVKEAGYGVIISKVDSSLKIISGNAAYKGKTTGKVRVILSKSKISEIKKGEILITGMTTPEYLLAMQKASAFVTDEGGITCHAAIIAREMRKPCIIGTKIATQVLKDGDLVEVDANKGVVKILKRAKSNQRKSTS